MKSAEEWSKEIERDIGSVHGELAHKDYFENQCYYEFAKDLAPFIRDVQRDALESVAKLCGEVIANGGDTVFIKLDALAAQEAIKTLLPPED